MAEKVAKVGVKKEAGYLYFVDKKGNVARARNGKGRQENEKAETAGCRQVRSEEAERLSLLHRQERRHFQSQDGKGKVISLFFLFFLNALKDYSQNAF